MDRKQRIVIGEILSPFLVGLGWMWKIFDKTLIAWWLEPWLQKKENEALLKDVQENAPFISANGRFVTEKRVKILPFNYGEIFLDLGNMRCCLLRGRGEFNISLSPCRLFSESYELAVVMAALDSKETVEIPASLTDLDALLRSRFNDLDRAFSEAEYPQFKQKLMDVTENMQTITRQVEWELNKRLGRQLRLH